jgi:hypothetical protein
LGPIPNEQYNPGNTPAWTFLTYSGNYPQYVGSLTVLLPYLEADNVFKQLVNQYDLNKGGPEWDEPSSNQKATQTKIKAFICPSDELPNVSGVYGANAIYHTWNSSTAGFVADYNYYFPGVPTYLGDLFGRTNYMGVAGTGKGNHATWSRWTGVLANRSKLTLGQLTTQDGTSNTLMYGESLGDDVTQRFYVNAWADSATLTTFYGIGRGNVSGNTTVGGSTYYNFGSRHAAGAQFAFGDASVRTVRFGNTCVLPASATAAVTTAGLTSDWGLLQQLAGYRDGYNNDTSSILD